MVSGSRLRSDCGKRILPAHATQRKDGPAEGGGGALRQGSDAAAECGRAAGAGRRGVPAAPEPTAYGPGMPGGPGRAARLVGGGVRVAVPAVPTEPGACHLPFAILRAQRPTRVPYTSLFR